jgi:hypothetical protein
VAPIEFSMKLADYLRLGGHMDHVRTLEDTLLHGAWHNEGAPLARRWEPLAAVNPWPLTHAPLQS